MQSTDGLKFVAQFKVDEIAGFTTACAVGSPSLELGGGYDQFQTFTCLDGDYQVDFPAEIATRARGIELDTDVARRSDRA